MDAMRLGGSASTLYLVHLAFTKIRRNAESALGNFFSFSTSDQQRNAPRTEAVDNRVRSPRGHLIFTWQVQVARDSWRKTNVAPETIRPKAGDSARSA
jgi:hypothetical protein